MIFDGRNDFQIFETLIPNCAWCCQNKPQLPASAGRVLTYFSIDSALCPYRFFILFVFGVVRFLRKATKGFASGHHELFEEKQVENKFSTTKNFCFRSVEIFSLTTHPCAVGKLGAGSACRASVLTRASAAC